MRTQLWSPLTGNAQRLAELLRDFDDTLELQWVPTDERDAFSVTPYRIVQNHPDYPQYTVMYLKEDELDHRVVAALFKARSGNALSELEAEENAKRAMELKTQLEQAEADKEFTTWAIKQNRTVKHNGRKFE